MRYRSPSSRVTHIAPSSSSVFRVARDGTHQCVRGAPGQKSHPTSHRSIDVASLVVVVVTYRFTTGASPPPCSRARFIASASSAHAPPCGRVAGARERSATDPMGRFVRRASGCGPGIADVLMRPRRTSLARRAAMRDASCGTSTMVSSSVVRRPSSVVRRPSSSVRRRRTRRRVTTRGLPARARRRDRPIERAGSRTWS